MALIVCPECGKEISDICDNCIHCGFPLINIRNTKCSINGVVYDFKYELPIALLHKTEEYISAIGLIRRKTLLTLADADRLVDIVRETKEFPESFTPEFPLEDRKKFYGNSQANSVECPYCHSRNTKKISDGSKIFDALFGGMYALPRMTKEWHCNACNSDF